MMDESQFVVPREEVYSFIVRCLEAVGTKREHAQALAELLVAADSRGHYSHGLNKLEMYLNELRTGNTSSGDGKEPTIAKESTSTALVDGNNVLGPVVGKFCMDLALKKAKETGIGMVAARGSNHFGIAGWYTMRAMEQGMLGMSFTNTTPVLIPTRAKEPTFGTNPLSLAAPGNNGDGMVLDMATTKIAFGKANIKRLKGEPMPSGWAVDSSGKETNDPKEIVGLLPLGGNEQNGGYKGYGLAMMVEVLCGILAGAAFGPNVRNLTQMNQASKRANLGHSFIAIDPGAFADGFTDRMSSLMDHCRNLSPVEGETEVLIPGDPERKHIEECDKLGGIPYHPNQIKSANDQADKLGVKRLRDS